MKIAIVGEKGGSGKTTLSVNIAAEMARAGRDVMLLDADPQASSSMWHAIRAENSQLARVQCVARHFKAGQTNDNSFRDTLHDLSKRYQDLVVDTGGRDSREMRASLTVADVAVLPVQASQLDIWTVEKMSELVTAARDFNPALRAYLIISRAPTNERVKDLAEAREITADYPAFELVDTLIHERVAYRRAISEGMSVVEAGADPKAAAEIAAVMNILMGESK